MAEPLDLIGQAACGLVLGSGIRVLEDLEDPIDIPFAQLPGLPSVSVAGHQGVLTVGRLPGGPRVAIARGRFHLYEGHSPEKATAIMELFRRAGLHRVILTNAAGGLVPDWTPGDLMLIDDHLNLAGIRVPQSVPSRIRLSPYSRKWAERTFHGSQSLGLTLRRGTYAWFLGPTYETPAEILWATRSGAHAVGMSTVPEAMFAAVHGMEVLGISCITNVAATSSGQANTSHQEVVDVARMASAALDSLLRQAIPEKTES